MQDAKSRLQEFLQQDGSTFPVYEIIGVSGPQHDPKFEASVSHNGSVLGHGFGRTKKEAEKEPTKKAQAKRPAVKKADGAKEEKPTKAPAKRPVVK